MSFDEQNSFCIDTADIEEAQAILARVRIDLAKVREIQRDASSLASRKIVSAAGKEAGQRFGSEEKQTTG